MSLIDGISPKALAGCVGVHTINVEFDEAYVCVVKQLQNLVVDINHSSGYE